MVKHQSQPEGIKYIFYIMLQGCHVVASAGPKEKVEWLLDEAKIDYAFSYNDIGENNLSSGLI